MSADAKLKDLHAVFSGILSITTNVMTTEGRKIACTWIHEAKLKPEDKDITCTVSGDSLEEVIRKVAEMEADFEENGQ